jgi:CubicO group peptidase (beta-lactamase class C family)
MSTNPPRRRPITLAALLYPLVVLLPLLAFLPAPHSRPASDSAQTAAIAELVEEARRAWTVPGVVVAVVRGPEVIYLAGHGVRDWTSQAPVTPDTVFPIGSCTKAFTTTALAMLVDEGRLGWDDPVRKHVPFFHLSDPLADRAVTIRDLVTHRTGLRGHDLLWYRSPWPAEEVIRRVGLLPLDKPFRSAFQYQSTMFTAAGWAVRTASGMPWEDFVEKRLFGPLGMTRTHCTSQGIPESSRAVGYRPARDGQFQAYPPYPFERAEPAGSVLSTARDLARWLRFHLAGGRAGGRQIVSERSLKVTHTPQIALRLEGTEREMHQFTNQISYAMGWVVQDYHGHRLESHAGLIEGFRTHLTLAPRDEIGIVVLANVQGTGLNVALVYTLLDHLLDLPRTDWHAYHQGVQRRLAEQAAERAWAERSRRRTDTRPSLALAEYAGSWEHPAYGTMQITLDRGVLQWSWHQFHGPLEHYQFDTFRLRCPDLPETRLTFQLDPRGRIARLEVSEPFGITLTRGKP